MLIGLQKHPAPNKGEFTGLATNQRPPGTKETGRYDIQQGEKYPHQPQMDTGVRISAQGRCDDDCTCTPQVQVLGRDPKDTEVFK